LSSEGWVYQILKGVIYVQTIDSIFIGYAKTTAVYRFILIHDNGVLDASREFRVIECFENMFPIKACTPYMTSPTIPTLRTSTTSINNNKENVESRHSERPRFEDSFGLIL